MSSAAWLIRAYREGDEEQVVRLWKLCFPNDPARNEPRLLIQRKLAVQRELFLVGLADGDVVATALSGYDGYRGWVYHVATHPAHQRRGYGRRMLQAVEQGLARLGCPKLNLQVRAQNTEAVRFYEALGYQVETHVSFGKVLT